MSKLGHKYKQQKTASTFTLYWMYVFFQYTYVLAWTYVRLINKDATWQERDKE